MYNTVSNNNRVVSWVLWGLCLCLGLFLALHVFSSSTKADDIYAKRVQNAVLDLEKLHETAIDNLISRVEEIHNNTAPNYFESLGDDLGIYVFNQDTLIFWNSNLIEPKLLRKRVKKDCDTILNLGLGDFLVSSTVKDSYTCYFFLC